MKYLSNTHHSKLFRAILLLFLTISGFSATGWAQFATGDKVSFALKGGLATNFIDINYRDEGGNWALSMDYWMVALYAIGVELGTANIKARGEDIGFNSVIWYMMANLKLKLRRDGVLQPYLIGGLELIRLSPKDEKGNDLIPNRALVYDQYQIGMPVGLGLSHFVFTNLSIDFQTVYHFSSINYQQTVNNISDGDDDYLTSNLGLHFYYGGAEPDRDRDGVPDVVDICPDDPEDRDGFDDDDGCPDRDNDDDGIPDIADLCPNQPEDFDGFEDEDGCPDSDNDGDRIPDFRDRCPGNDRSIAEGIDTKEDFDGFQDKDGCPDFDNDGDGIPDVADSCPNAPETFNGLDDEDGCPDEKPSAFASKLVLHNIYFRFNSAELDPTSEEVLDYLAEALLEEDSVHIVIRGYTDNIGSEAYNLALSQRRAESVRNYLISKGVPPHRLTAIGMGERDPIANNATEYGRARNRRIEIEKISPK
jgi:outer membrane protein OmpA-like peptidoglycan-associated protein/opacity protein-like surface antigen